MRITELARLTGVTVKAVRYYERIGLLSPTRLSNGYRDFDDHDVRIVSEIRELSEFGIAPSKAAPFIDCLDLGHDSGDECVSSLAVYRDTIAELDRTIASLTTRRHKLQRRLDTSAAGTETASPPAPTEGTTMTDFTSLPQDLPVPEDDGAATHLPGTAMPSVLLPTSGDRHVDLADLGTGRTVIYLYPLTGRPGEDLPDGWDNIPGARGCSTEACSFRDHFSSLQDLGVNQVFGLSSQTPGYQDEVVSRLALPFEMLSDQSMALADELRLPTFTAPGHTRLYSRLTLIVRDAVIEHVFYPIFPPNTHAEQVLDWLRNNPVNE